MILKGLTQNQQTLVTSASEHYHIIKQHYCVRIRTVLALLFERETFSTDE
jgi:hypothetical protein